MVRGVYKAFEYRGIVAKQIPKFYKLNVIISLYYESWLDGGRGYSCWNLFLHFESSGQEENK